MSASGPAILDRTAPDASFSQDGTYGSINDLIGRYTVFVTRCQKLWDCDYYGTAVGAPDDSHGID
jgi:hypothetical protein